MTFGGLGIFFRKWRRGEMSPVIGNGLVCVAGELDFGEPVEPLAGLRPASEPGYTKMNSN
jgi:hypothetical protein